MALAKLVKTSSENPQSIDIFKKMTSVIELPVREFGEMLMTPILEEFHTAMAPIYDALAPLMEDLGTVILTLAIPIMKSIMTIINLAQPFIDAVRTLLGVAGVEPEPEPVSRHRNYEGGFAVDPRRRD